jgi:flavin reductase (DIM6/NTAB) family NADH-FMN oxidoreductase RutF
VAVGAHKFRDVLRLWSSGVSVVTTRREGGIQGITVSSFTSLSLDPPLILICIDTKARSHAAIAAQRCFAVNILRGDQTGLSDLAAGRRGGKGGALEELGHRTEITGAPVLEDCLAWLDCSLNAAHEGGDHTIYVGRVEAAGTGDGEPLLWFDRDYARLARRR